MRRLGLGFAIATMLVMMPKAVNADDQQIANKIMQGLQTAKQQGQLKGFQVDMKVQDGTVWFSGFVANAAQEQKVFEVAQSAQNLGLVQIVDNIEVRSAVGANVAQAAYVPQDFMPQDIAVAQEPLMADPRMSSRMQQPRMSDPRMSMPADGYSAAPMPMMGGQAPMPMNGAPMGGAPMGGAPMMDQANLPNHSWPSYAAYPNYAGVTYPGQYSASAWPYIGPFYPYPQVPLGWRKVQLEWNDGWWYLDFKNR